MEPKPFSNSGLILQQERVVRSASGGLAAQFVCAVQDAVSRSHCCLTASSATLKCVQTPGMQLE